LTQTKYLILSIYRKKAYYLELGTVYLFLFITSRIGGYPYMKGKGPITCKEEQILGMLAEHRTYEDIRVNLHVSMHTLYCHIQSLMIKTGQHKKELLIGYAIAHGYGGKKRRRNRVAS
jgi:DNA-binding CsgD family transcriptional regulator